MNAPSNGPSPRPSPLPPALRWLGPLLAAGFACGTGLRRFAYAVGIKKIRRAPMPVLSVGNLTAGGTGKTPMVAYLAQGLLAHGLAKKPAILMRGYGSARPGEPNDEARELARLLGETVPVICNPHRYVGAQKAQELGCDCAILDDGFQHWQLARDLDLVLIDATDPFGGGHLLPWGRLRESPAALQRAHAVVVTRIPDLGTSVLQKTLAPLCAPSTVFGFSNHRPVGVRRILSGPASEENPETLRGRKVLAMSGIGNPAAFAKTLAELGASIAGELSFADHYAFTAETLREAADAAKAHAAEGIAVTEKDAAKLELLSAAGLSLPPVYALRIACAVHTGETELWARIADAIKGAS